MFFETRLGSRRRVLRVVPSLNWPMLFWRQTALKRSCVRCQSIIKVQVASSRGKPSPPPAQGLYDPKSEHDACGVGFVADLKAPAEPQDRRARPPDPGEPDPSRRRRRRPACRRRRRHPGADPARIPQRGHARRSASSCPSPAITPSAICSCRANRAQRIYCESVVERVVEAEGLAAARLARRADRQFLPVGSR